MTGPVKRTAALSEYLMDALLPAQKVARVERDEAARGSSQSGWLAWSQSSRSRALRG